MEVAGLVSGVLLLLLRRNSLLPVIGEEHGNTVDDRVGEDT